jgi:hypothetical protein
MVNIMILKKNVGYLDSIIRVTLGTLIIAAGLYFDSYWGFVGLIPVITGAVSYCPLYRVFGIETCNPNAERAN